MFLSSAELRADEAERGMEALRHALCAPLPGSLTSVGAVPAFSGTGRYRSQNRTERICTSSASARRFGYKYEDFNQIPGKLVIFPRGVKPDDEVRAG